MTGLDLHLLFPQGIIAYTGVTRLGNTTFTINLIFSNTCLAKDWILCTTLNNDNGLDYATIQIDFFHKYIQAYLYPCANFSKTLLRIKFIK